MAAEPDDRIDLQTAADQIGVHYQTAYRWVRSGKLRAAMVGGRYLVSSAALREFDDERRAPRPPTTPGVARLDRTADRMHDALVDGDERTATSIARQLIGDGAEVIELIQEVFVPSLRRIGQAWHDGHLTIWVEHRASAIVERILGVIAPNPRGRRRGTALVAALSGDHHSLPTTMAAVVLRDDNWNVEHLGADMPGDQLVDFCAAHPVTIAVLTVTNPDVADLAGATAERLRANGIPTIVGGPGRTLTELVEFARNAPRRSRSRSPQP